LGQSVECPLQRGDSGGAVTGLELGPTEQFVGTSHQQLPG
jgi:hypothetical protein